MAISRPFHGGGGPASGEATPSACLLWAPHEERDAGVKAMTLLPIRAGPGPMSLEGRRLTYDGFETIIVAWLAGRATRARVPSQTIAATAQAQTRVSGVTGSSRTRAATASVTKV